MASYLKDIEEKDFMDLLGNEEFEQDLKNFFQGGRYNYSDEEVQDTEQLARDFVQHMRWQETNESTAMFDLNYVKRGIGYDQDEVTDEGLMSFGKLMQAYDVSDGGGTGFWGGAWDYMSAFAASPSTAATVATFGFGVGSKIAAKAAGKATQIGIRKYAQNMLQAGISKQTVKEAVKKKTVGKAAAQDAAISFAGGAALGGVGSYGRGEAREEVIEGYDYGPSDLAKDAMIDGTLDAILGGFGGAWTQSTKNKALDAIVDQADKANVRAQEVAQVALDRIKLARENGTSTIEINDTMSAMADIAAILRSKEAGVPLDKLPEDKVELGQQILNRMMNTSDNSFIAPGLDMNAVRGIAAASIELRSKLKLAPGQRITEAVADGLENGTIDSNMISQLRKDFNLSAEELSYVWMAELSKAGSILAEGSRIKKAIVGEINVLSSRGASVFTGDKALETIREAQGKGLVRKGYEGLQNLDGMRIAFMTSQLGTTAANVVTGVGNTVVDMSDAFWKDVLNATVGVRGADGQVQRRWTNNTFSVLRGFTVNRVEAEVLGAMLLEDSPTQFTDLFYESQRIGDAVNSQGLTSRAGRFFNTLNMATDAVFKQGAFYGAVDRRLRELNDPALGANLSEYLKIHTDLEALRSSGVLSEATDYAKRFTFQRDYKGDNSVFGKVSQGIQRFHKQAPFIVSSGLDMPFPRYISNHLEYINDYTPIGIVTGGMDTLEKLIYKTGDENLTLVGDTFKTGKDRVARQMTGTMLTIGGIWAAVEKEGEIDYTKFDITGTGSETDVGRVAGPWAANLLIGDWVYRSGALGSSLSSMGYKIPDSMPTLDNPMEWGSQGKQNLSDVLGGMTDLGFDPGFVGAIAESVVDGEWSEDAQKLAGNIVATFTYPGTIARDVAGQLNPDVAGTPFTRDVRGGPQDSDEVSVFGERNFLGEVFTSQVTLQQMTRFLMDSPAFSLGQSNRNETGIDLKKYTIFNSVPLGGYNPIARQFGFNQEPPSTGIQKELNKLGINEYEVYGNKKVKNPAVDYAVRKFLALGYGEDYPSLSKRFDSWRSEFKLDSNNPLFLGRTYDELETPQERREALVEHFINPAIAEAEAQMTGAFENMLTKDSGRKRAAGFLRNLYVLEAAELEASTTGTTFDDVVKMMMTDPSKNFDKKYQTAREFIEDSSGIEEELTRREMIIDFARENFGGQKAKLPPVDIQKFIPLPVTE